MTEQETISSPKLETFIETIEESKKNTSYSDTISRWKAPDFGERSWEISQAVLNAFEDEDAFISKYREKFSIIIAWCIGVSVFAILIISGYTVIRGNLELSTIITVLVSLVAEITILLKILFNYIFNKNDNKLLDILQKTLEITAEYEMRTNKNDRKQ